MRNRWELAATMYRSDAATIADLVRPGQQHGLLVWLGSSTRLHLHLQVLQRQQVVTTQRCFRQQKLLLCRLSAGDSQSACSRGYMACACLTLTRHLHGLQVADQLDAIPFLCRFQYARTAEYLLRFLDPLVAAYTEAATPGALPSQTMQSPLIICLFEVPEPDCLQLLITTQDCRCSA